MKYWQVWSEQAFKKERENRSRIIGKDVKITSLEDVKKINSGLWTLISTMQSHGIKGRIIR